MAGNVSSSSHGASVGSWVACFVIIIGFIVGGVALIYWSWPFFWVGVGIVVVGCVIARAVNIMEDVSEYGGRPAGRDPASSSN